MSVTASTGSFAKKGWLGSPGFRDALLSVKRPLAIKLADSIRWLQLSTQRREKVKRGDVDGALKEYAKLVTSVQFARERRRTYRDIDAFLHAHAELLRAHLPDDSRPQKLVLFVGQSRSGHSLVGSLIDAHPDAVIAHELHALKHLIDGCDITELSRAIQLNAHLFDLLGRAYTGYDYAIPGQWQGRHRKLIVIGDKKGNGTTRMLRRYPDSLDRLEASLELPLCLINVIRNPFDNIATKAKRTGVSVEEAGRRFFANARTLDRLTRHRPHQVTTIYLDDLIDRPKAILAGLIDALGLSADVPGYLDASASLIFEHPKRTRDQVAWPPDLVDRIRTDLARSPTLARFADATL